MRYISLIKLLSGSVICLATSKIALAQLPPPSLGFVETIEQLTLGSHEAQVQLEQEIYEYEVSRELASRTLILRRCANRRAIMNSALFDEFASTLSARLRADAESGVSPLSVRHRLVVAIVANRMTIDQAASAREIAESPTYTSLLHFLGAERAWSYLAAGFQDVNTGEKQPWIAVRTIIYLRSNPFWVETSKALDDSDRGVIEQVALGSTRPSDPFHDVVALDQLTSIAEKFVRTQRLRKTLPEVLAIMVRKYDRLELDALQMAAMAIYGATAAEMSICLRSESSCVPMGWFDHATSRLKQWEEEQFAVGESVLLDGFSSICDVPG